MSPPVSRIELCGVSNRVDGRESGVHQAVPAHCVVDTGSRQYRRVRRRGGCKQPAEGEQTDADDAAPERAEDDGRTVRDRRPGAGDGSAFDDAEQDDHRHRVDGRDQENAADHRSREVRFGLLDLAGDGRHLGEPEVGDEHQRGGGEHRFRALGKQGAERRDVSLGHPEEDEQAEDSE